MRILSLVFIASALFLGSCGAENDAKDVCDCYKEVVHLKGDEADTKMEECIKLVEKYQKAHKEAGTLDSFNKAYDHCR